MSNEDEHPPESPPTPNPGVVREQSNAIVYAARCLGAVVRDLFVLRGRYAETRLVPDHPDVLDVPLRATLASTVVLWMLGAAIAFAGGGESGGKATALIGALFAVALLTAVLHLSARAIRGTGTWRQTAAVVCVCFVGLDLGFVALGTISTLTTLDFQNPVSVAENVGHPELTAIADTRSFCVAAASRDNVPFAACHKTAVQRCAALPAFERSDCDTHFSNGAPVDPGSVLGRFSARRGIDHKTIFVAFMVFEFVSGLAMFVVFVVYLLASWICAVHGFSRRRARWITVAMASGAFAIYANLSTHGFLDVFDPLLEFLDALS